MNSIIITATVATEPLLKYTVDANVPVAEMTVSFPGPDDRIEFIQVTAWNGRATELQERCHRGDSVIVEGRLTMRKVESSASTHKQVIPGITVSRVQIVTAASLGTEATTSVLPTVAATETQTPQPPAEPPARKRRSTKAAKAS